MALCGVRQAIYLASSECVMNTLWCSTCSRAVAFTTEVPPRCATCNGTTFKAIPSSEEPKKDYKLSMNDRRFLKSLRIQPEI